MAVLIWAATALAAIPVEAGFAATDVFLPSVGRKAGNANSQWYTMLWIHNPTSSPANVAIWFLLRNQANPAPATFLDTIPPGDSHSYPDTITTLFNTQAWGALRITADTRILATCRMYNLPPGGEDRDTQGQDYAAIPATFAIGAGQSTTLLGVHQTSPKADSQFRYSFGWVETAGGTADVQVTAYDESGTQVASKTYPTTAAYEARYYPIEDLYPAVNSANLTLKVSVVGGAGKLIAVGSGTANVSNDSTTFEMQFADSLLAGATGLTAVTHDASLTGDGTPASALGVADAGISKQKLKAAGGTNGQVLATDGTNLVWQSPAGVSLPYAGSSAAPGALFAITDTAAGVAIQGVSPKVTGVSSTAVLGVLGTPSTTAATGQFSAGVRGDSQQSIGVLGSSDAGAGVMGTSAQSIGVWGSADSGIGVIALSNSGTAIKANSNTGLAGEFAGRMKVAASSALGTDIFTVTNSGDGRGFTVTAAKDTAVWAVSGSGIGLDARSTSGNGINASSSTGYAGYFFGKVNVTGTLTKGGGAFKIDNPIDPEHKYLYHSFVESPDMKDIYDGTVVTDANGRALVQLPAWFEALNRDFRYQLTVIGRFAQAIVEHEIENNQFVIRTNLADVKVSWQVTGIRKDPFANANRIPVEEEKRPQEQGLYLHPAAWGKPPEKGIDWARRSQATPELAVEPQNGPSPER